MKQNEYMKNPHLEGDDFFWKGKPTGILLIHGFTATTAEVRLIAEKLHEDGYTCAGPLLPGHGTDPDDLNRATWGMWLEKVKEFYEHLARECEHVFVIGESMGTLLALELAVQHPEINGLMLFSPTIKIKGLWLSRILQFVKDHQEKSNVDDGLPWKGYTVYPVKAAAEMHKLQVRVKDRLSKIQQPTLIFTGESDTQISSDAANIILNGIKSEVKRHIHMEESPHVILLANELDKAYDHVVKFISDHSQS
jgi:carboxylesterase